MRAYQMLPTTRFKNPRLKRRIKTQEAKQRRLQKLLVVRRQSQCPRLEF